MLMEALKKVLGKLRLPADTRKLVAKAGSPAELARQLDRLITANELEYRGLQKEIEELERQEAEEVAKVRAGELGVRSKKISLMNVQRLRRQEDALETRLRIHDDNMKLHQALLGKIQAVEAMDMRGLEEEQVDAIAVEFQEELERYTAAVEAGATLGDEALPSDAERDRELEALEAEILGTERAPREEAAQARKAPEDERETPSSDEEAGRAPERRGAREDDRGKEAAWD